MSRRTISTGTAISPATRRSRSGWSARSDVALVGVDDDLSRAICARLKAQGGRPRVVAVSGAESPLADVFVRDRRVVAAARPRASVDLAGARALRGAHNGQNAAFAYAAARALGVAGETIAAGFPLLSGSRAPHGRGRAEGTGSVHQRLEGDQRRRGREGAAVVSRHPLDSRRKAEGGRHRAAPAALCARGQGLSHRRGDG